MRHNVNEIQLYIDNEWVTFPLIKGNAYTLSDVSPFSQRTSTGQTTLSSLVGIAAMEQRSFSTGAGQRQLTELGRYNHGNNVWTQNPDYDVVLSSQTWKSNYILSPPSVPFVPIVVPNNERGDITALFVAYRRTEIMHIDMNSDAPVSTFTDVTGNLTDVLSIIPLRNKNFATTDYWALEDSDMSITSSWSVANNEATVSVSTTSASVAESRLVSDYMPLDNPNFKVDIDVWLDDITNFDLEIRARFHVYDPVDGTYSEYSSSSVNVTPTVASTWETKSVNFGATYSGTTPYPGFCFVTIEFVTKNTSGLSGLSASSKWRNLELTVWGMSSAAVPSIYDMLLVGDNLLVATDMGIAYCTNTEDVFDGVPAVWERASDYVAFAKKLYVHDGYLWYVELHTNLLHYGSDFLGRDLEGLTDNDSSPFYWAFRNGLGINGDIGAVTIGTPNTPVKNLASFDTSLYVFKDDSMYAVTWENGTFVSRKLKDVPNDVNNYESVVYYDGALVYQENGRLWRFLGTSVVDITPRDYLEDDAQNELILSVYGLVTDGEYLYGIDTYGTLVSYDGAGWHTMSNVLPEMYNASWAGLPLPLPDGKRYAAAAAFGVDNEGKTTLVFVETLANETNVLFFRTQNKKPYKHESTGYIRTSWFNGSLFTIPKVWRLLRVEHTFTDDDQSIDVYYLNRKDNKIDRILLGTIYPNRETREQSLPLWSTTRDFYTRQVAEFKFDTNRLGEEICFDFVLNRGADETKSPRLHAYLLQYVARPRTIYAFVPRVLIEDGSPNSDGTVNRRPAIELLRRLMEIRDHREPILFREPATQQEREVFLTALQVSMIRNDPLTNAASYQATLSLTELEV